jgi:hypothetical protein
VLHGNGGDDILIGGTTDHDSNLAALNAIMAEWGRTDLPGTAQQQYNARVDHLRLGGGLNGDFLLTAATVHDDAASDRLYADARWEWFFALLSGTNKYVLKALAAGEVITSL